MANPQAPTTGSILREARASLQLGQSQLGARVGVSRRAISQWENDQAMPRHAQRVRLVALLASRNAELARRVAVALGEPNLAPAAPVQPAPKTSVDAIAIPVTVAAFRAADALDVAPQDLRRALAIFVAELRGANVPLDAALGWLLQSAPPA